MGDCNYSAIACLILCCRVVFDNAHFSNAVRLNASGTSSRPLSVQAAWVIL